MAGIIVLIKTENIDNNAQDDTLIDYRGSAVVAGAGQIGHIQWSTTVSASASAAVINAACVDAAVAAAEQGHGLTLGTDQRTIICGAVDA
jgi:hypothetical protein